MLVPEPLHVPQRLGVERPPRFSPVPLQEEHLPNPEPLHAEHLYSPLVPVPLQEEHL